MFHFNWTYFRANGTLLRTAVAGSAVTNFNYFLRSVCDSITQLNVENWKLKIHFRPRIMLFPHQCAYPVHGNDDCELTKYGRHSMSRLVFRLETTSVHIEPRVTHHPKRHKTDSKRSLRHTGNKLIPSPRWLRRTHINIKRKRFTVVVPSFHHFAHDFDVSLIIWSIRLWNDKMRS